MHKSESINELATALSKAQGEITGALKDSANPFFKSKYSDLASCWDACRAALTKHGLAIVQFPMTDGADSFLHTVLTHSSGQYIGARLILKSKDDTSQAMGSAITYARRYALCAVVGVAQVDDDGNAASGRGSFAVDVGGGGGGEGKYTKEVHSPKGDMGKNAHPDQAFATAVAMRELLDADLDHRVKTLKIYDKHLFLVKNDDLYVAASGELKTDERTAWKAYVKEAKELEKDDKAITNIGKRF